MENEEKNMNVYEKIENLRESFLKEYNKEKIISIAILVAFVLLMFAAFAILISMPNLIHYVLVAIVIVFLGTYLLTKMIKKTREESIKKYVEEYRLLTNAEIYKDIELSSVKSEPFEKINASEIEDLDLFEDFNAIQSNDIYEGIYKDLKFSSANAAVYNSKNQIIFYGKIFSLDLKSEIDGKIILHLKSKDGNGPKNKGLSTFDNFIDERFVCFSSFEKRIIDNLIDDNLKAELRKIKSDDCFKDFTFVFYKKKIYVFVSCKNDIIDVPLKEPLKKELLTDLKSNVIKIFDVFKEI